MARALLLRGGDGAALIRMDRRLVVRVIMNSLDNVNFTPGGPVGT